ncbi:MAG: hypothetical protein LBQ43_05120 [Holosporales bacterium]|nr:hypothetical protein [Holosporales bacterium]
MFSAITEYLSNQVGVVFTCLASTVCSEEIVNRDAMTLRTPEQVHEALLDSPMYTPFGGYLSTLDIFDANIANLRRHELIPYSAEKSLSDVRALLLPGRLADIFCSPLFATNKTQEASNILRRLIATPEYRNVKNRPFLDVCRHLVRVINDWD